MDDPALPLDASVATVGSSQLVHQRGGGLALAVAADGLDLVGVGDVRHHVPAHKNDIDKILMTTTGKMGMSLIMAKLCHS